MTKESTDVCVNLEGKATLIYLCVMCVLAFLSFKPTFWLPNQKKMKHEINVPNLAPNLAPCYILLSDICRSLNVISPEAELLSNHSK